MNVLKRFLLVLQRDQRGAVTLTYLLCFPVILLALLGSIDFIRYSMAQSKLQNALDTAVISAGRNLDTFTPVPTGSDEEVKWRADAISYFFSNMPQGFLGSSVSEQSVDIIYREETDASGNATGGQLVSMSATGTLPLLVTGMIDRTAFNLSAQNEAVRRTRSDIEMVLALDNSGSMDYSGRMATLKTSSSQLVATLFNSAVDENGVAQNQVDIGLVPFTGTVRIGDKAQALKWLNADWVKDSKVKISNYIQNIWSGCIAEPAGTWSNNHPMPAKVWTPDAAFQPLFLTYSYNYSPFKNEENTDKKLTDLIDFGEPSEKSYDRRLWAEIEESSNTIRVNLAVESEYCTEAPTSFLTSNPNVINNSINRMYPYGDTGVPVGLLWAWRMLSPQWRGEQGWGSDVMPRDPVPGRLKKVIVLLSDGDNRPLVNNWSDGYSESEGRYDVDKNIAKYSLVYHYQQGINTETATETDLSFTIPAFRQCPVNPLKMYDPLDPPLTNDDYDACVSFPVEDTDIGYHTGYTQYKHSPGEDERRGKLSSSAYNGFMSELCEEVKKDGNDIKIYSITLLGKDMTNASINVMRNCASGANYYYNTDNVAQLPAVFAAIAGSLTELRLTE